MFIIQCEAESSRALAIALLGNEFLRREQPFRFQNSVAVEKQKPFTLRFQGTPLQLPTPSRRSDDHINIHAPGKIGGVILGPAVADQNFANQAAVPARFQGTNCCGQRLRGI